MEKRLSPCCPSFLSYPFFLFSTLSSAPIPVLYPIHCLISSPTLLYDLSPALPCLQFLPHALSSCPTPSSWSCPLSHLLTGHHSCWVCDISSVLPTVLLSIHSAVLLCFLLCPTSCIPLPSVLPSVLFCIPPTSSLVLFTFLLSRHLS